MGNAPSKRGTVELVKTTLFEKEPGGVTYRIPSLVYLPESHTYLAFAEKRTSPSDIDAKILVIRKRTITEDGSIQWSPSEELSTAQLPDHRTMNPCPVYDSNTQTVYLFFICVRSGVTEQFQIAHKKNEARLCCVTSRDHGATWSGTEDLTESNGQPIRGTAKLDKTTLFEKESGLTYRIPSLLYLHGSRTYLAFAEKRTSAADHHAKCLVMRRMTPKENSTQWSPSEELSTAQLPDRRTMNPCPVYDSNTQTVYLFFICVRNGVTEQFQIAHKKNEARLCCVTSRDHGATWSGTEDLTESVIGETLGRWATFGVGPGHGVQLAAGRLVVPAYAYVVLPNGMVESQAFSIYKEGKESPWQMGNPLGSWSNECKMAEVIDGDKCILYCNARTTGPWRVEAQSTDSGNNFERSPETSMLVETGDGCHGSTISFPAPSQSESVGKQTWLAFSHPTNTSSRLDLGVSLNRAPLQYTWDPPMVIHSGPSGYSDLAYNQDDQRFSCLLECGEQSEVEQIAFVSFTLDDIRQTSG
ncbi:unnamed protein product [Lota lota]